MRFSTFALGAAVASISGVSAAPQKDVFHVTDLVAQSVPHSADAEYTFFVSGTSSHPNRQFAKTRCHAKVGDGSSYQRLLPVTEAKGKCDNDEVTFKFQKYVTGDVYGGWELTILHRYTYQQLDVIVPVHDSGSQAFPFKNVKWGGEATGKYRYIEKPTDFNIATKHHPWDPTPNN